MQIKLSKRTENHVISFWEKTQDAEIQSLFPFVTETKEDALKLFRNSLNPGATSYGSVIYVDEKYIGDIWVYGIDECDEKMAMLSIVIFDKTFWGKHVGLQAIQLFLKEVFSKYSIDKIGAFTYQNNIRSLKVLKKSGFEIVEFFVEDNVESVYLEYNQMRDVL